MIVLVIEDEASLLAAIEYNLRREGYAVLTAAAGPDGLRLALENKPDLILLDIMLPDMDGLEICRRVRRVSGVPILILSARGDEIDRVVGLEIGADDYLTKPFSMRELVARVRAMLRRAQMTVPEPERILQVDGLSMDPSRREVIASGASVTLKPREFDLLAFLVRHPGQVFSRDQLLERVWGYDFAGDTRTVDTHVKTLRDKLGDLASSPRWIETVRGVGYRLRN